ncbi:MAG: hypothetical protein IPK82_33205 [Polyangiaceae bacterium]|nr:hypothetical protein [Polyangiaceae bacterium]
MKHPLHRSLRFVVSAACVVVATNCAPEKWVDDPDVIVSGALDETRGIQISAAVWTLEWDTHSVTPLGGGGFEVTTDLGYRVSVEEAWLLSHSVSFGSCDTLSQFAGNKPPEKHPWYDFLPIHTAWAHTEDTDPSTLETSYVEDLTKPSNLEFSTAFTPARYCRAHWLLARATNPTQGAIGPDMAQRSLYIKGFYEKEGKRSSFLIDTWWPHGLLVDLSDLTQSTEYENARRDGEPRHAFVTVTRSAATLFNGIDFETATNDELTGLTLNNLVDHTMVDVTLWNP